MAQGGLPQSVGRVLVPPIKCQGIKTKLVPFIMGSIRWEGAGRWIEPFLGSGVIALNVRPKEAILADTNPHIIAFYQGVADGSVSPGAVEAHLLSEGSRLGDVGESHYYEIRDRFNQTGDPLDFLFLNRSCFNGVMRFNRAGSFNVPFCRKNERFSRAYVTKITNQVRCVRDVLQGARWEFVVADWRETLARARRADMVYCDPPYVGRHTDYYDRWSEEDAAGMASLVGRLPCGFAVSMWRENRYRRNDHIDECWEGAIERNFRHFYHVGSTEDLRNEMNEALLVKQGWAVDRPWESPPKPEQVRLDLGA